MAMAPYLGPYFANPRPANRQGERVDSFVLCCARPESSSRRISLLEEDMVAGDEGSWRRTAAGLIAALVLSLATVTALVGPTAATSRSASKALNSTDAILKWINGYRNRPDPTELPAVV